MKAKDDKKEKNVIIVAVSEYSFKKALIEHIYAFPKGRIRIAKKFITFYRISPIKAITHYATVEKVLVKTLEDFSVKDILMMFGHHIEDDIVTFELSELIKLEEPVKFRNRGIKGFKYTTLSSLLSSEYLDELD